MENAWASFGALRNGALRGLAIKKLGKLKISNFFKLILNFPPVIFSIKAGWLAG